jgi:hypothetical protein
MGLPCGDADPFGMKSEKDAGLAFQAPFVDPVEAAFLEGVVGGQGDAGEG